MYAEDILRIPEPDPEVWWDDIERSMTGLRRIYLLMAALDLGVFDSMDKAKAPAELAQKVGVDSRFADGLCASLCEVGLLMPEGDNYVNSPVASTYLNKTSLYYQNHSFDRTKETLRRWQDVISVLKAGPEPMEPEKRMNGEWVRGIAERSILGRVQEVTRTISEKVDLSRGGRMLDLGGGHGLYAIAFCARNPGLQVDVFDRPSITPVTKDYISRFMAENVKTVDGDFEKDEFIGNGYDFLFSSFNQSGSDPKIISKMKAALKVGGKLIVRRHTMQNDSALQLFEWSLNNWGGPGGRSKPPTPNRLSLDDYRSALEDAGFKMLNEWSPDRFSVIIVSEKLGE
jgi:precorrin-6B methylase 2